MAPDYPAELAEALMADARKLSCDRRRTYESQPGEFTPASRPCPACGGPMPVLNWNRPAICDRENVPNPTFHVIALRPFFAWDGNRVCRRCSIRRAVATLLGKSEDGWQIPHPHVGISDPTRDALRRLEALSQPPTPPPPDPTPEGSLFKLGRVFISAGAARAVGRGLDEDIPSIDQRDQAGRRATVRYLALHASKATSPPLKADALEAARALSVKASPELQNAVAIADGVGSVRSSYSVVGARQHAGASTWVHVWTEFGLPGQATLTLCYTAEEASGFVID